MKQDRQGVRTPADLERKYNLLSDAQVSNLATEAQRIAKRAEAAVDSLAAKIAELESGVAFPEWELIETIALDETTMEISRETDYLALGLRIVVAEDGTGDTRRVEVLFSGQNTRRTGTADCSTGDGTAEIFAWTTPDKGFARCFVTGAIPDWETGGAEVKCSGTIKTPVKGFTVGEYEIGGLPSGTLIEVYGVRG